MINAEKPEFAIFSPVIGGGELGITEVEYHAFRDAGENIFALSKIEELFTVIGKCLISFERLLFDSALSYAIGSQYHGHMHSMISDTRANLNVEILSLLNACHAYCDQSVQIIKNLAPCGNQIVEGFKRKKSACFDESIEYRICAALRNHAQHSSLPVEYLSYGMAREWLNEDVSGPFRNVVTVSPCIKISTLIENKDVRSATRSELRQFKEEKIELRAVLRAYVSKVFECHSFVRDETETIYTESASKIKEAYTRLSDSLAREVNFVSIQGYKGEEMFLNRELAGLINSQRNCWLGLQHFPKIVLSNEVRRSTGVFLGSDGEIYRK